tara:strand:- start:1073 stop:2404 length:1332 start_codon:yes stop_codon:yes gene_type:complete
MGTLTDAVISTTYKKLVFQKSDNKIYYTNGSDVDTEITTFASPLTLSGLVTATLGVKLGNNIIYNSDAEACLTLDADQGVSLTAAKVLYVDSIAEKTGANGVSIDSVLLKDGIVKLGGNIIQASDGGATITLDTSDNVAIAGDLTVNGGDATITAANDASASILLQADNSDDAGDDWKIIANSGQTFTIGNDIASAGSFVSLLTITPHATASSSSVTIAGDLAISGGNITTALTCDSTLAVTGVTTLSNNLSFSGARDITWTDASGLEFKDVGGSTYIAFSENAISLSQPSTFSAAAKATFNGGVVVPVKKMADGDVTLTAADSGKYVIIEHATTASRDLTLPAVADGLNFKVKLSLDLGQILEIKAAATGNFFEGGVTHVDTNTDVTTQTMDTQILASSSDEGISLAADTKAGTWIDLVCDGTTWFISGTVYADTAPTYVDV